MIMAPIKRTSGAPDKSDAPRPSKRIRVTDDVKGKDQKKRHKRSTSGQNVGDSSIKPAKPSAATRRSNEVSILREDEPSFPRGGASILTPLEHKQIQAQATRDVLFEQKAADELADGLDDNDGNGLDVEISQSSKKGGGNKARSQKKQDQVRGEKPGVRIEALTFKVSYMV